MCFCDTGDRFHVCYDCLKSVEWKGLNHLFATKAHLVRAERSETGRGKELSVFLVMHPRSHCTLLQMGRCKSKLEYHQLLFFLGVMSLGFDSVPKEHWRWGPSHSQAVM